jgi:uncharacterized protein (TIGR02594 family)
MAKKKLALPTVSAESLETEAVETVETVETLELTEKPMVETETEATEPVEVVGALPAPEIPEPVTVSVSAGLRPPKAALPELGRFGLSFDALPLWMQYAVADYGTEEVAGPKANAKILEYHQHTTLKATSDEVPWCAAFVCAMLEKAGFKSTHRANAKSFLTFGKELPGPQVGAVAVLNRGTDPASGHVGFVVGFNDSTVYLLGGNQSNMVRVSSFQRWRVLQYRWPVDKLPALAVNQKGGK